MNVHPAHVAAILAAHALAAVAHADAPTSSPDEVRAIVSEMLADAQARTSLLDGSPTSGYEKGFFLASSDKAFMVTATALLQFRYVINNRDDAAPDDLTHGFQAARTRIGLAGHVVDPSWKFVLLSAYFPAGNPVLFDAFVKKEFDKNWSLTFGQFKLPLLYEWLVPERQLQLVDRSLVENRFSQNFSQGVMLSAGFEDVRASIAFSDGLRSSNTDLVNAAGETLNADWAFTARAEAKLAGEWSQYSDHESWRGDMPLLVLGAAVHAQDGFDITSATEQRILRWTADGSWKFSGGNIFAAIVGSHETSAAGSVDLYGAVVQGGVFVTDDLELLARYEWGDLDDSGPLGEDLSILSAGFSRFFARHALKFTLDGGYAFNPVDRPWTGTLRGILPDVAGDDGQIFVRAQFQLLF